MTKQERLERQIQRLEELKRPEAALHQQGYRYIAGVDEAGRGPLAGPVVAAAVILPEHFDVPGVDDSKKLSEKKRNALFPVIKEQAVAYGIGMADHRLIDQINILQATKVAMKQALDELQLQLDGGCGTDGKEQRRISYILLDAVELTGLSAPQQSVIRGDSKVLAIAAASILAKVTRDRMMEQYARQYPGYAFERNKGYGTKAHYEGIRQHGLCPIHRRSFLKNLG